EATGVTISADGHVLATVPGQADPEDVGTLQLATFVNPAGLSQLGENLFGETAASGPPVTGDPGEDSRGKLQSGVLESSTVDPTRELIDLICTQRAYEMNSQSIRAADQALQTIAQLRR